ncbi:MAG: DUF3021 domain-containing protein [Lachnospiraceae bacterium]|nr:DUF3021 domain-containing protein [Lachnospiraceae bacterium]
MFGNFIKRFLYITVGIFVVCGAGYKIAGAETVTVDIFGMILLSAFATTLATVLILPRENEGKVKSWMKFILHYMVICVIMSFLGIRFGWVDFGFAGIVTMVIYVGLVYLLVFIFYYLIDKKQAGEINKMLQEKYGEEES